MAIFRLLTRDEQGERAAARTLKVPWTSARRDVAFLLEIKAIEPMPPVAGEGGKGKFQIGQRANEWIGWAGGPLPDGVAPPAPPSGPPKNGPSGPPAQTRPGLLLDPHAGTVKISVLAMPADPSLLPGCYRHKAPSGAKVWWFHVVDESRNMWSIQLNAKKAGELGTLSVTPPKIRTRNLLVALDVEGRQLVAHRVADAWGRPHGLQLAGSVQQVKAVEYAAPGMGLAPGIRSHPDGRAYTDDTPSDGSLETQDRAVVQAVATLPEDMAHVLLVAKEVRASMPVVLDTLRHLAGIAAGSLEAQALTARALASSSSLPTLTPTSGVEYT